MKKRLAVLCLAILSILLLMLSACSKEDPQVRDLAIKEGRGYGSVELQTSIDEFNEEGFEYGDSVDISFSNGYQLKDVPYYNGYYSEIGEPLLVAYPGEKHVYLAINYGSGMWSVAGLKEGDTITVVLAERGKYKKTQEIRDIHYTDQRSDYDSEHEFSNFREIKAGDIKAHRLYRGASPVDDSRKRAATSDDLIKQYGIGYVVDLADLEENMDQHLTEDPDPESPYFQEMLEQGKVCLLGMNVDFRSEEFQQKMVGAFRQMTIHEGPYYIHCQEGKDRTGYVCMVLEALCGASYQEIVTDYMKSYENYYGITEKSDREKYQEIKKSNIDPMLQYMIGEEKTKEKTKEKTDLKTADLQTCAEQYLQRCGMTEAEILALRQQLI